MKFLKFEKIRIFESKNSICLACNQMGTQGFPQNIIKFGPAVWQAIANINIYIINLLLNQKT